MNRCPSVKSNNKVIKALLDKILSVWVISFMNADKHLAYRLLLVSVNVILNVNGRNQKFFSKLYNYE